VTVPPVPAGHLLSRPGSRRPASVRPRLGAPPQCAHQLAAAWRVGGRPRALGGLTDRPDL